MQAKKENRFIGNTTDKEIEFPRWPKFNVYADTETFIDFPQDLKIWEHLGKEGYEKLLEECELVPWLLVWTHKAIYKNPTDTRNNLWINNYAIITDNLFENFFQVLRSIYHHKRIPVLWFHNASYDLNAIIRIWKFLDPNLVVYYYAKDDNKFFLWGAMYSPKFNFKCQLGDTMLYETISIEAIGRALKKEKMKDVPYSIGNMRIHGDQMIYTDVTDGQEKTYNIFDYINYAIRDVEIQRDYGELLPNKKNTVTKVVVNEPETYDKVKKNIKGVTQGSFSKELCNVYLKSVGMSGGIDENFRWEIDSNNESLYLEIERSNIGGYTTFNKDIRRYHCLRKQEVFSDAKPDGKISEELILVFDCNSEYPYILTRPIPYGELLNNPPIEDYITWYVVSFKKCTWKEKMNSLRYEPIPMTKINDKFELRFYMCKEYYEMIDRLCNHESTIHEIKYQRSTTVLKPLIENLYKLRKEYKEEMKVIGESDPEYHRLDTQQQGCKILMNSLYGKLCEKPHLKSCFYYGKTCKYTTYKNENAKLRCILSGSYVTYSGRLILLDKVEKCIDAGFKVVYTDTDSVMLVCSNNDLDKVKEIFGEDTGELGQWKCEGQFNLFLNSGVKKKYCLLDTENPSNFKIAWSGVSANIPNVFKEKLKKGDKQAIEDLKTIFSPNENILFKYGKRIAVRNKLADQKIISETHIQMNPTLGKVTGEFRLEGNDYILEKYER